MCERAVQGREMAAVHVRAGDIVEGDWRQVLQHEKYVPTPFIEHAIGVLSREQTVLILSDNAMYLDWLRTRLPSVVTADRIIPGYDGLSEIHRALADILLLSHCRTIVGPPTSSFSGLAPTSARGRSCAPTRWSRADENARC